MFGATMLLLFLFQGTSLAFFTRTSGSTGSFILPRSALYQKDEPKIQFKRRRFSLHGPSSRIRMHSFRISSTSTSSIPDEYTTSSSPYQEQPSPSSNKESIDESSEEWLIQATNKVLLQNNSTKFFTPEDVRSICGLMTAWARQRSVHAAIQVEHLLKRIIDDIHAGNTLIDPPNTRMYIYAMDAWAKNAPTVEGAAQRAHAIHDALIEEYQSTPNATHLKPTVVSYNTVLNAWAKSNHPESIKRVEQVLDQMIHEQDILPDAITLSTVLDAFSRRATNPNMTQKSQEFFDHMTHEYNITPNPYVYYALQNVYARSNDPKGTEYCLDILDSMRQEPGINKPTCMNYNTVLLAASRRPSENSTQLAISFLEKMESSEYDVEPDTMSYAFAILTCARCPNPQVAARTSREILERMEERSKYHQLKKEQTSSAAPGPVKLDMECYNTVLTCIARSRDPDAPQQVLKIIRRMEAYADEGGLTELRPVTRTWNALLNAYARQAASTSSCDSRGMDSSYEAEAVLTGMLDRYANGMLQSKPDEYSFAAVLSTLQKSSRLDAHTRADELVRNMDEMHISGELSCAPDVYHYTILCGTWARSGSKSAVGRCLQILSLMMDRHQEGFPNIRPNIRTYNAVLDCLARHGKGELAEEILFYMLNLFKNGDKDSAPDIFTFNSVIRAHCNSGTRDAGQRAETILERLLEYCETENKNVQPSVKTFGSLIAHYRKSRSIDAPYRAEYILSRLCSLYKAGSFWLQPDIYLFSMVVDGYAHSKHPDAGLNADRFLRAMITLRDKYGADELEPTTAFLNRVLFAWANSGDPNAGSRCEAHLSWMETQCAEGVSQLCPDEQSYRISLSAWAKSKSMEKVQKCLTIIGRMENSTNLSLDEHSISLVINACAFANNNSNKESFETAVKMMDILLDSKELRPSSLTYGWFIQACGRLKVPNESPEKHIRRAFKSCCEDGLVNSFVIHRLRGATSNGLFREMMRNGLEDSETKSVLNLPTKVLLEKLPTSWKRNVQ